MWITLCLGTLKTLFVWALNAFFDSLQGGPLVHKNGHFIGTKMPVFNNFGNSSQHLKFDAGQNSTVGW